MKTDYDALKAPFVTVGKNAALLNLDEAWEIVSGGDDRTNIAKLYRNVSYLFRAVDIVSNAAARMPFQIETLDGEIIDESHDYKNTVGFLPNPGYLFGINEAALQIWGYSYNFRVRRGALVERLRYMLPSSVKYNAKKSNPTTGNLVYDRNENGTPKTYSEKDIVNYWYSDPFVEFGPPQSSPAQAAAAAGGILLNVDDFAAAFFARGAIEAQLLLAGGVVEPELSKLRAWWRKVAGGVKNAWGQHVLNAETVQVHQIGRGIESLDNRELTNEQREAIATALGVPHSILFSNAANFAVSEKDDFHFYDKKIVPDCLLQQRALNEQVFNPLGYRMRFTWEDLDVFQEDEKERAASLQFLTQTLEKGPIAGVGMKILGYEVDDDTMAELKSIWDEKKAEDERRRADFLARTNQAQTNTPPDNISTPERPVVPSPALVDKSADLEKWRRYAHKRVKDGKVADRAWESEQIEPALKAAIYAGLLECDTIDAVDALFDDAWIGYP